MPEPGPKRPRSRKERLDRLLREADSCCDVLRTQREIRIYIEHAVNRGHQASSLLLLRHLIRMVPLSAANRVTVVYDDPDLLPMLAGFLAVPSVADGVSLDGVPLRFRSADEIRREPWVDFGCTGACDLRQDLSRKVRCRSFLWMQPYRWGNLERILLRSGGAVTRDAPVTHPWTADLDCQRLAFTLPPPAEPDWASLEESRSLRVVRAALAAGRRPDVALLPVYGMGQNSPMGSSHLLLRNVLLGARDAVRRGLGAAVLVLDLSVDVQPEEIRRLCKVLDIREEGSSRVCTDLEEDPGRLQEKIDALARGELLLVHAGGFKPQPVFEYVLSQAKLPFIFEGAGTAARAVTLGRPFLHVCKQSFQARKVGRPPRSFEMAYPFLKGFGRSLPHSLQKAADSVLRLKPAPELIGSVLLDCARSHELLRYFETLGELYGDPRRDRLRVALGLLHLLRSSRQWRGRGRVPSWSWDRIGERVDED